MFYDNNRMLTYFLGGLILFSLLVFFFVQLTKKISEGFTFEPGYLLSIKGFKGIYFSAFVKKILFFIYRFCYVISTFGMLLFYINFFICDFFMYCFF